MSHVMTALKYLQSLREKGNFAFQIKLNYICVTEKWRIAS